MPRTPLVLVGDAPGQPTGLSRILTDLAVQMVSDPDVSARYDVRTVGWGPWGNLPAHGVAAPASVDGLGWPNWVYGDFSTRGRYAVSTAYRSWFGTTPGVLFTVWDPARCVEYLSLDLPVQKWGYFPVDAENRHGTLGGPAATVVRAYDRVLAYGPYGRRILTTLVADPARLTWLPHGYDPDIFAPSPDPHVVHTVGCVAANQARKDLPLFFAALAELHTEDPAITGWLHTDRLVSDAWSVPELIASYGVGDYLTVTQNLSDLELAVNYRQCWLTIAPGLGEGFGYPILESLACGVPVLHVDYAGGADLLPVDWRIPPDGFRPQGPYLSLRPIVDLIDVIKPALNIRRGGDYRLGCVARAADYAWAHIWPAWRAWLLEA